MSVLILLLLSCTVKPPPAGTDTAEDCTPTAWYADADGDGFGAGAEVWACTAPAGHAAVDDDCDDADPAVHPGAEEVCNGVDDDCDGVVDPPEMLPPITCYRDIDEDGWGIEDSTFESCACPEGYATQTGDCNDDDPTIHPGATETWYDGVDQDCAGEDDFDADGDGWRVDEDCDDNDPAVHPGAEEICGNGIDDDCDGLPGACGIDAEWDVTEARLEILSMNAAARASPLGSVADVDGDGQPELALGWWTPSDQGCGPGETFFEVHVTSLAASGTEAAGDRSLATLVAPVDCRAWSASAWASGTHDLNGDGSHDTLVLVSNQSPNDTRVPSRVYLVDGTLGGEIDLSTVDKVEQPAAWGTFGNLGMAVANTDLDGGAVIVVASSWSGPMGSTVVFIGGDHFLDSSGVEDAPALTFTEGWAMSGQSVADIDGDGVADLVVLHSSDGSDSFVGTYLGPLVTDIVMGDADGEIRTGGDPAFSLYNPIVCPVSSGDRMIVAQTLWDDSPHPGDSGEVLSLYGWDWTSTSQDLSDAVFQILNDDAITPMVSSCTGDLDANGEPELILTASDDIGEVDTSIIKFADMPDPGTWYVDELVRGQVLAPTDRAWSSAYDGSPRLIADIDFTGDGADDLVFGLAIQPAWYEPEETGSTRTLMFPGSPAGL